MIVSAPPFEMSQQVRGLLRSGPGTSCERCHAMTDGQIHPLAESGVQPSREGRFLQGDGGIYQCLQAHHERDVHQLVTR